MLAVILTPQMWKRINGATHATSLGEAAYLFPNPVSVTMEEQVWIVIPLRLFLQKVRQKQRGED